MKKINCNSWRSLLLNSLIVASFFFQTVSYGAPRTWSGNGADDFWGTSANWDTLPVSGDSLFFNGSTRLLNTNNLTLTGVAGIRFLADGFRLSGNSFPLTTNGITNLVGTNVIGMGFTWGVAGNLYALTNTELVISGALTNPHATGSSNIVYKGGGRIRITGAYYQPNNNPAQIVNNAELIVDGGTFTNAGGFRIASDPSPASSKMILTNGATMSQIVQAGAMRIGDSNGLTGTFIMDNSRLFLVSNIINIPFNNGAIGSFIQRGGTNSGGVINFIGGSTSGTGSYEMVGGLLGVHRIQKENAVGTATISFDGSTLRALTNSTTFFTGIDTAEIKSGGLVFDNNGFNVTVGQDFIGAGGLTKMGTGTLTMGAGSTYSGGFTLSAGTMAISGNAFGTGTLSLNGGTLQGNNATARSANNAVSIGGNTTIGGTATITLSGPVSMGANLTITSTAGATLSGAVTLTGNRTITVTAVTNTLSGAIGGDAAGRSLTKAGTGVLSITSGANTYSGNTTISAGSLQVDGDANFGTSAGTLVFGGGSLLVSASRTVATANPVDINANATVSSTGNASTPQFEFSGNTFGGTGGVLTFTNAGGILSSVFKPRFSGSGFTFTNAIALVSATTNSTELNFFNTNGTDQIFSGVISGTGSLNRSHAANGGNTILTAANTFSGGVTLTRGSIGVGNNSALSTNVITPNGGGIFASGAARSVTNNFTFSSGLTVGGTNDISFTGILDLNSANRTITVTNTALSAISGAISSSVSAGNNALTKAGSGVLEISSANSYAGDTVISAGTLRVNNVSGSALGSGNVTVASGALLTGTGSISGAVTNAGIISPGASPGTLATGSEVWTGGGSYKWEINDDTGGTAGANPGWDKIAITGTLDITAAPGTPFTIDITSLTDSSAGDAANFDNAVDHTWVIVTTTGGITGFSPNSFVLATNNFSNAQGSGVFNIATNGNDLVLKFVHPPTITIQPANVTKTVGEDATFSVTSDATTFQWRKNGSDISGATDSSYTKFSVVTADAGNYDVIVGNASGTIASSVATLTVNKADQTINFGALGGKTYGDADFEVSATSSSGLPVSFSIFSGPATIVNGTDVHLTGAGTVTVRASQSGNADTNAAPDVDQSFEVSKATLLVSANNTNVYGSAPVLTPSYSGFLNADNAGNSLIGAPDLTTTATTNSPVSGSPYTISVAIGTLASTSYNFSFSDGILTVVPAPLVVTANLTKIYGATNPPLDPTYIGFMNGEDTNVLTGSPILSTTADTNSTVAGSPHVVTVDTNDLASPNYSITASNGTLAVTAATLTVTADNTNRVYGASNPAFTASYSGFVNGETEAVLTGSPGLSTTATAASAVGPHAITAAAGDLVAANYSFNLVNGTLTITPASLTVSADNTNRAYGASNPAFTGSVVGIQNADNITANYNTAATTSSVIGNYPITISLTDPDTKLGNYNVTTNEGVLTVTGAAITITSDNTNRVYGAANPTFTGSISGLQNGDDITADYAVVATVASSVGVYTITQTLNDPNSKLGNYTVTTNNGSLTITAAEITITSDNTNRVYGAANPTFTGSISGLQNSDDITADYATTATAASPVGGYPITQTLNDPDTKLGNYTVSTNDGTLTVTSVPLTVTVDNKTRASGEANPVFTGVIVGIQNSDDITATYSTDADTGSPAGTYAIIPTLVDPDSKLGNYSVTTNHGTLTVLDAPVITTQPTNVATGFGTTAIFSVIATGSETLGYQWRHDATNITDGEVISGATSASLTLTGVSVPDEGDYDVVVTNYVGSVTSSIATLTLVGGVAITNQPDSVLTNVTQGASVTFEVGAEGGSLTYQWYYGAGLIIGATDSSYTIPSVQANHTTNGYIVIVSNPGGSVTSAPAATIAGIIIDANKPTVGVTTPKVGGGVGTSAVTLTGSVKDLSNGGLVANSGIITSVKYRYNPGNVLLAESETNTAALTDLTKGKWSFTSAPNQLSLLPGTNIVHVWAQDLAGNVSDNLSPFFVFYDVTNNLVLKINGTGTGTGVKVNGVIYNGPSTNVIVGQFKVGRLYTAETFVLAGNNSVFTNWTASPTNIGHSTNTWVQKSKLPFVMQPAMTLTATFNADPYPAVLGKYYGLFYESGGVTHETAGHIYVTVKKKAGYSGTMLFDGNKVKFSGKFNADGTVNTQVARSSFNNKLPVQLAMGINFDSESIGGTVSNETWVSDLYANKQVFFKNLGPFDTTNAGSYTFQLPSDLIDEPNGPKGVSFAWLTNSPEGIMKYGGQMADGSKFTGKMNISREGALPFYVPLYKNVTPGPALNEYKGSVLGWLNFDDADFDGVNTLSWIKKNGSEYQAIYGAGFTNNVALVGSPYVPPLPLNLPITVNVLDRIIVTDGNLLQPVTNLVTVSALGKVKLAPLNTALFLNKAAISFKAKDGTFAGAFLDGLNKRITKGVVLQNTGAAAGHFVGTSESGTVILAPAE